MNTDRSDFKKPFPAWIVPLLVAIAGVAAILSIRFVSDKYMDHHNWPAALPLLGAVFFLWGVVRLIIAVVKPEHRGAAVLLAGVLIMLFCWLVTGSLPGIIAGGFIAVIGVNLFARRGAAKASSLGE